MDRRDSPCFSPPAALYPFLILLITPHWLDAVAAGDFIVDRGASTPPCRGGESLFNVKDFGATGDGVTDDTLSVQTAIEAASNGTIVFTLPGWHDAINSRSTVVFPAGQ